MQSDKQGLQPFSEYEKTVVVLLALTQFTVTLDFSIMSPLGDIVIKNLGLTPSQFGLAVSAYAFSAGLSGILIAGLSDSFDRKKLMALFYIGFIIGTFKCGISKTYESLLFARMLTGFFGGIIGSISLTMISDFFPLQQRGRAIGYMQMGFETSQVLGLPAGLFLSNKFGWNMPFMIVGNLALIVLLLIIFYLKKMHLSASVSHSPFQHLTGVFVQRKNRLGFAFTAFLSVAGFMIMPFASPFAINNLHITNEQLPVIYMASGIVSLLVMSVIGRWSDQIDNFKIFIMASLGMVTIVLTYTGLGPTPFVCVLLLNVLLMTFVLGMKIPANALVISVPQPEDRGAYMSINAAIQQVSGGVASAIAVMIITQKAPTSLICIIMN